MQAVKQSELTNMHEIVKSTMFSALKLSNRFIYAAIRCFGKDILVTDYHSFYERCQIAKSHKVDCFPLREHRGPIKCRAKSAG
jgi:hypothetical protein